MLDAATKHGLERVEPHWVEAGTLTVTSIGGDVGVGVGPAIGEGGGVGVGAGLPAR